MDHRDTYMDEEPFVPSRWDMRSCHLKYVDDKKKEGVEKSHQDVQAGENRAVKDVTSETK